MEPEQSHNGINARLQFTNSFFLQGGRLQPVTSPLQLIT